MSGVKKLDVAYLLEKGGANGYIRDANTGLPIPGATMNSYKNNVLVGSGLTPTNTIGSSWVEVINLPKGSNIPPRLIKLATQMVRSQLSSTTAPIHNSFGCMIGLLQALDILWHFLYSPQDREYQRRGRLGTEFIL